MSELEKMFEGEQVEEPQAEPEKPEESAPPAEEPESIKEEGPTLVPVAALLDERRKRQAIQEELKNVKGQLPQDTPPDRYEDPEAYDRWLREKWERERLEEEQTRLNERIERSESEMLEKYSDYTQMKSQFLVLAQLNPELNLSQQMIDSSDPAKFAYEKGKEYVEAIKKSAVDEYLSKEKKDAPEIVPSLASATAPTEQTLEKGSDLKDMFADQKY